ncbi:HIT family protein [Isoptericola sp. 178]|uniref:HIT family protein n=1 Tax=Isoptericola sp. 178 TaxID=3064651 RepID=UPI002712C8CA|nr:HIT domain-containing protein [Isoptericola sp. 178]MDO8145247.1 hypothetical protein [Isoptericola sp. 178]
MSTMENDCLFCRIVNGDLEASVEHHEAITDLPAQGRDAQQSVFHSHLHVIPRVAGDGVVVSAPDRVADRAALDTVAEALRARLAGSDPGINSHTPRETRAPL